MLTLPRSLRINRSNPLMLMSMEISVITHPHPSSATVKLLYARALRCAHPNCTEPLYREDERSEKWTLNSRIAHICARSEGGPRWDSNQSATDNRSDENLLLLCITHASVIDDPANISSYREQTLRDWKRVQLQEHSDALLGWPQTEAMANEALSSSYSDYNQTIIDTRNQNSPSLMRAGDGGSAVGEGAIAGNGGSTGNLNIYGDDPKLFGFLDIVEELLSARSNDSGTKPGSGGTGADAMGPYSIAGDGGNSGDISVGTIHVEAGDTLEIIPGRGGKAPSLPGQHGEGAEDTVCIHKATDGRIKKVYRTAGAIGAQAGKIPDSWSWISEDDLMNGFQISTLMLANAVEYNNGSLCILGGGTSRFMTNTLPESHSWLVVCRATWEQLEDGVMRGLQMCLSNPDGEEVVCERLGLPEDAGTGTCYNWWLNLSAPLDREGLWRVSVNSGEYCLAEYWCEVILAESQ